MPIEVTYAQWGTVYDRYRELRPQHSMRTIHKLGDAGAQDPHRPQDDASGDQQRGHGA